jgi:glycosyltransferase involved in cell wall biosynthesis
MRSNTQRVLMLLENSFPRDPRVEYEAYTLTKAGYQVTVIALTKRKEKRREIVNGVVVYRFPFIKVFKGGSKKNASPITRVLDSLKGVVGYVIEYFYFTFACLLLSFYVLMREGFDVVHAHNPPDTLFIVGAFYRLFGKRFVFDHHDLSPELYLSRFGAQDGIVHKGLLFIEKLCLRSANIVISTNESYKKIAIDRGSKNPKDVIVVRNGPDLNRIRTVSPDKELKKMNKTILGYLGALNPQDGVDYLLRSIRYLAYEIGRKDFYCVIVGRGDALEDLKKLAHELEIEEFVRLTGYISDEDMLRYLSTADICVDPDPSSPLNDVSTWIKVMEYMALGKPIVSFDLKETRFSALEAAMYVTPNNEEEFAKAIVALMDDPAKRAKMGAFGKKRIKEKLGWQHESKNLLYAYEWLLDEPNVGRSRLQEANATA